jgi:hypothetical protein
VGKLDASASQSAWRPSTRAWTHYASRSQIAQDLAADAPTAPDTADPAAVAERLDEIIGAGYPKQAKALPRLLIAELRSTAQAKSCPPIALSTPRFAHRKVQFSQWS